MASFGNRFWFQPDVFTYLYERGMSRGHIFRCLKPEVTSLDDLRDELISQNPSLEKVIDQTFKYFEI